MNEESYTRTTCPHCHTRQFVWMGTWKTNTEAAECCSCGKFYLMGEREEQEEALHEIILVHKEIDYDKEDICTIRNTLLDGGVINDPEELDLSGFLKKYAMTEKGTHASR